MKAAKAWNFISVVQDDHNIDVAIHEDMHLQFEGVY